MLEVEDLHVWYGGIHALRGVSLRVPAGSIVGLIGANGAGKSTTLRAIMGLARAKAGRILLNGSCVNGMPTHAIAARGVALVPEGRRVFPNLTVWENLLLGAYARDDGREVRRDLEWVQSLFPRLKERARQKAGLLSGGEQQMLAIARALMSRPRLLLMDEPSLGLAPLLVQEILRIIRQIHEERGTTILLVEQNVRAALQLASHAYVLETGRVALSGPSDELLRRPEVRRAYLGKGASGSGSRSLTWGRAQR